MMWWHTMSTVRAIIHIAVALTRLVVVMMQSLLVSMLVLHVVTVRATVIAVVPVATCVLMAVLPRVVVVVEHDVFSCRKLIFKCLSCVLTDLLR